MCSAGDAVQGCGEGAAASLSALAPEGAIEARYSHSGSLPGVLEQAKCSLLVSARQADQPVSVGTHEGQAIFSFNGIGQAVGVAVNGPEVVSGAKAYDGDWRHPVS